MVTTIDDHLSTAPSVSASAHTNAHTSTLHHRRAQHSTQQQQTHQQIKQQSPEKQKHPLHDNHKSKSKGKDKDKDKSSRMDVINWANAATYVMSGCLQPLLMTLIAEAGLGDSTAQLYMIFYYLGPASAVFQWYYERDRTPWPSNTKILHAAGIGFWDISATTLNYTGAALAGPTIFSIIYSSVTVWTAVFSKILLGRQLNGYQWVGVVAVFGGLTITATSSTHLGSDVIRGVVFATVGSAMHAMTYVLSEGIMTKGGEASLTVAQNCTIQGTFALIVFSVWEMVYTFPRYDELIAEPMEEAGTSMMYAWLLLISFFLASIVHSLTFYHTLRYFMGGATSAGVMKGLQAVLVFVLTDAVYCGRLGGQEMCFSSAKFMSLVTVVGGVLIFGAATKQVHDREQPSRDEYEPIHKEAQLQSTMTLDSEAGPSSPLI